MAGLYFTVGADFNKLQKLKSDIDNLKVKLQGMNKDANPKEFAKLEKQLRQLSVEFDREAIAAQRAGMATRQAGHDASSAVSDFDKFKKATAFAGGTAGLIALGKELTKVRSEFQNTEAMFKVFLGNGDKAKAFLKDIQSYAFNNVFEFKDLTGQAAQLLAFGTASKDVIGVIDKLSNVAAGVNQPLERFVELYNKAKSRGKLDLIDVQQWSVMGDVISEIAEMQGKSRAETQKMISEGNIGFKEIDALLNKLTSSGGRFYGMMTEKMKTLGDSIGLLEDTLTSTLNEIGEKSEDFLRGGILAANTLVENYEKIGEVLLGLIAIYGLTKTASAVHAIAPKVISNLNLIQESKSLETLLSVEQKALISKQNLTKGTVEYATVVKSTALANVDAAKKQVAALGVEASAQKASMVAAKARAVAATDLVAKRRLEMIAAQESGKATKIAAAEKRLDTAVTTQNTVITERNAAMKAFYSQKAKIQAASQTAATLSTQANTAAQTANVTTTNILTAAKIRLNAIATKINATLAANKFAIITAAAVALAYVIYKVATATTEWEDALKRINSISKEYNKSIAAERAEIDILFGRLKGLDKSTQEYQKTKETILSKYGSYLSKLNEEIRTLKDIEGAYKAITAAAIDAAKARAIESGTKEATEAFGTSWSENIEKIQEAYIRKYGNLRGTKLFTKLREQLEEGLNMSQMTEEVKASISTWDDTIYNEVSGNSNRVNFIENRIIDIQNSRNTLKREVEQLNSVYGEILKVDESGTVTTPFVTFSEQVDGAKTKVSELKTELENLKKGIKPSTTSDGEQFDFAKGIEDKVKEVKDAENKLNLLLHGQSTSDSSKGETAAEKARKKAQDIADQQEKINLLADKQKLDRIRTDEDLENQAAQARISAMESGSEKVREQQELDNKLAIQALQRQKEDYIRAFIQIERDKFDADEELKSKKNSKYKKKTFNSSSVTVDASPFDAIINNTILGQNKVQLQSIIDQYQDYYTRREELTEKYDADLAILESKYAEARTDAERDALDRSITQLKKQWKDSLSAINLDELKDSIDWGLIFGDLDKLSTDALKEVRDKLKTYLKEAGDSLSAQDMKTVTDAFENLNIAITDREPIQELKAAYDSYRESLLEIIAAKEKINKLEEGTEEHTKATKELTAAEEKRRKSLVAMTVATNNLGQKGSQVVNSGNEIIDMLSAFGVEVSESVSKTLEGVGQIMSGLEKIDLNKPMSIITGSITILTGLGKTIAGIFGGGGDDNGYIKMKEQYDRLNDVWDQLLEKKKEYLSMSFGEEARKVANESEDIINKQIESYRNLGIAHLNSFQNKGGSSWGARQKSRITANDKKDIDAWAKKNNVKVDITAGRMEGLFKLDADQIRALREEAPEYWAKMNDETKKYLEGIEKGEKSIQDVQKAAIEQLTQVSFESVFDSFVDTLMDMDSSAEDFADNFGKYLQRAIITSLVATKYNDRLEAWTKDFADYMEKKDTMTEEESKRRYNELNAGYNEIVDEAIADRDNYKEMFGWESDTSKQEASKGVYQGMSQDTGERLEARNTAIHMTTERMDGKLLTISNSVQVISTQLIKVGELTQQSLQQMEEIKTIQLNSFYELKDINSNTKELYDINKKMGQVNDKLSRL